jgi:DnaJ family protein A protein 3
MEDGQVLKIRIREDILKYTIAHDPFFYIYVRVKRDDYYVARDDLDVYSQADVSVAQAILGGQLVVRGLHDKRTAVDVPEGTGSHQALCCTGQGIHR